MKKIMNKKVGLLMAGFLSSALLIAQETEGVNKSLSMDVYDAFYIFVFIFLGIIVINLLRIMKFVSQLDIPKEASKSDSGGLKFWNKINSFKPMEMEKSLDVGHSYDGIRELDNVAPPWFTIGFLFTIVFSIVYMYRYHVAKTAPLMVEEYEMAVAKANEQKAVLEAANPVAALDIENLVLLGADDIEAGKQTFGRVCASCHGVDGGGGAGPNLTDDHWIHGGSLKDIYVMIRDGFPEKAMPAWSAMLNPEQINQVTSYVKSLKGTTPVNPKPPQGELYQEI